MKNVFVMIIAAAFVFCLSSQSFAETITKIAGNKITIMNDRGKTKTIESNAEGLKVGDKVKLITKDGRTWLNPQPEPPAPVRQDKLIGEGSPVIPPLPPPKKSVDQIK